MATRTKKAAPPKAPATTPAKLEAKFEAAGKPDEAAAIAKFALRPSANSAVVIQEYGRTFGDLDLAALVDNLAGSIKQVNAGDMTGAEAMLYAQAQALQAMFTNFSRRALKQEYQKNLEAFFRMALKAQNQCRMTLETLANIKNPPVVFARQANINNGGQQQVNNGTVPTDAVNPARVRADAGAHAAIQEADQTGLLEASDGQRMDTGAQGAAGGADPHLATVGEIDRPAYR